jgi:hypothetical protein
MSRISSHRIALPENKVLLLGVAYSEDKGDYPGKALIRMSEI